MKISVALMIFTCLLYFVFGKQLTHVAVVISHNKEKEKYQFSRFLVAGCLLLFLFAALRGDFATDYRIYTNGFYMNEGQTLYGVLMKRDWGYGLISYWTYHLFGNPQALFIVTAFIMMLMYYKVIKSYSVNYFLSLLILIAVDNYVISFNLARNIMAVSICLFGMKYMYNKSLRKYLVVVLIASTIHRSALIMLPMYWLLKIDFRKQKNLILMLICAALAMVFLWNTKGVAIFVQDLIGMDYLSYDDYGLDFGNVGSAIKTTCLFLFIFLFRRKVNFDDIKERIWFNACLIAWVLQILAAKVLMIQRVGYYFSGCFLLLIPLILSRLKEGKKVMFGVVTFLFIYDLFFQNVLDYYFFWQNIIMKF